MTKNEEKHLITFVWTEKTMTIKMIKFKIMFKNIYIYIYAYCSIMSCAFNSIRKDRRLGIIGT